MQNEIKKIQHLLSEGQWDELKNCLYDISGKHFAEKANLQHIELCNKIKDTSSQTSLNINGISNINFLKTARKRLILAWPNAIKLCWHTSWKPMEKIPAM